MKKTKIIFLLTSLSKGGGERVASQLSLNLPDSIEITIVLLKNQVSFPYKGKLVFLNLSTSKNFISRICCLFLAMYRFKKIIKAQKPDRVISFGAPANAINVLVNKKSILRIESFMTSACKGFEGAINKILIKIFYNKSEKIIRVSKEIAEDLINNFGILKEKIEVIYNPINLKEIHNLAKESLEADHEKIFKSPVVISMGRLGREKNYQSLIKVFGGVKNSVKEAKLVIMGEGELKQELMGLIKDLNLSDSVYLLGWQENPFKFLVKSKVFVLCSLWEGLPNAILEAMASGLPVISVDCRSGPREILAPKTEASQKAQNIEYEEFGILTPAFGVENSEAMLQQAIIKVLTDKRMADDLAKKSHQRAQDFDVRSIIRSWDFL